MFLNLEKVIVYSLFAGIAVPLGAFFAQFENIQSDWLKQEFRHSVIAYGGGILVAAVALVLVPEGMKHLDFVGISISFLGGGFFFFCLDKLLARRGQHAPQFTAMLLDYLPESLALGAAFAAQLETAPLLALFIGLQNFPEGFNAYRELIHQRGYSAGRIMWLMIILAPLGVIFALFGMYFVAPHMEVLSGIMLFSAGGIMYLIFQDIAPQARLECHWGPPLGAVLGFWSGMLGQVFIQG